MLEGEDGLPLDARFQPEPLVGGSQGTFEGIVVGGLLALSATVLATRPPAELAAAVAGMFLGGAVFALSGEAWAKVLSPLRSAALLFGSGVAAATATLAPLAIAEYAKGDRRSPEDAAALLGVALCAGVVVGIVQLATRAPLERLPRHHPLARILLLLGYAGALGGIALLVGATAGAGESRGSSAGVAVLAISALPFLAVAAALARRAGARLRSGRRPARPVRARPVARLADSSEAARDEVELAALTTDPAARRHHLATALEHARAAHVEVASGGTYEPSLSPERRRHVELAFSLGDLAEIDALAQTGELEPFLAAENARLRGDPARAVELASAAFAASEATAADRANALSVLALAETDLSRFDDARARLEAIGRAQAHHAPFLGRFLAIRIEERIHQREIASSSTTPRSVPTKRESPSGPKATAPARS
jgi:hypothetical protein